MSLLVSSLILLVFTSCSYSQPLSSIREEDTTGYCTADIQCYPNQHKTLNLTQYIYCTEAGNCQCSSCFVLNVTTHKCQTLPGCTLYNNVTSTCYDIRKRQSYAIGYAAALTISGAANFYIERWELAVPQLVIGIIFTILPFIAICVKTCLDYEYDPYEYKGPVRRVAWCVVGVVWGIVTLTLGSWWIIDLIQFSLNNRLDGRGCPLR